MGNKRVAITATAAFLPLNGYRSRLEDKTAYEFLIGLYERGRFRFVALERWLRAHTVKEE